MKTKLSEKLMEITKAGLLAVIISFTCLNLSAQKSGAGIKGGLNLSFMDIDGSDENKLLPGLNAGVFARLMITDKIAFQPEVLYSMKGTNSTYSRDFLGFEIANGETKLNINYIDIPLHFAVFFSEHFDIHAGPYLGFLMNARLDTRNEILDFINVDSEDEIDRSNFNNIDAGISAGFAFSSGIMTFGINYNLGLRPVANSNTMEDLLGNARNNSIQVYAGLVF